MAPKRTDLSDILKRVQPELETAAEEPTAKPKGRAKAPKAAAAKAQQPEEGAAGPKEPVVKQSVYLHPAVHDQLRDLAHSERVRMHALLMEGLDAVFRQRGLKSIQALTKA